MKEINVRDIRISAAELINDMWGLVSAGTESDFNTMTVSWGALGEIWNKDAAFIFIRPQRYTKEFLDREELFTISFYGEEYRNALKLCGAKSGRDIDKAKEAGLTPVFTDGTVTFREAKYTVVCRKMAVQKIEPEGFLDDGIEANYPRKDYHIVYIGEIVKAYEN